LEGDPGRKGAFEPAGVLALAERVAREAGEILLAFYGRLEGGDVRSKGVAWDLVTSADVASEQHIVSALSAEFPDHAIEAEEQGSRGSSQELRWFVDPLDGTINFVHNLPCFAVSIALYRGKEPEVAVVHAPQLRETFTARRGGGAFLNGAPIAVSQASELSQCLLATGFPYRRGDLEHDNLENFGRFFYDVRGLRRMGSAALDLAYTAAGRFDGYWELHLSPHDVAAGALLVREAGGLVSDADGGDAWLRAGHIVASGPAIHRSLIERIRH
jgi:myo-inositol-1(or 4)-monophosphatase